MISFEFDNNSGASLYVQLYEHLKEEISEGHIRTGERLPSLRNMAKNLGVSVTTVKIAYDQLMVEGYLVSRPQSGFYAAQGAGTENTNKTGNDLMPVDQDTNSVFNVSATGRTQTALSCDPDSFDFVKWKKCMSTVLNETPQLLLTEADRQGEPELRQEIANYVYKSRGVKCTQEQVVISAGTQQLVSHIARILKMVDIAHVSVEDPGYLPVRSIFSDWGFSMSCIPVKEDGIVIEKLPENIRTAVYVCPQNQFPTGAVMPINRRRKLLEWAEANGSIIIEDDYNSELRYTGMPIPALQGIDQSGKVVYIGSFTSTLFPAIRISYMILPREMIKLYERIRMNYDQTCSKTEQLTLAEFMRKGYYYTNLKRIRKLYSLKLHEALSAIREYGSEGNFLTAENTQSGINIILRLNTYNRIISEGHSGASRTAEIRREMAERIVKSAASAGIKIRDIDQLDHDGQFYLAFYYNQIKTDKIREAVKNMIIGFKSVVTKGSLSLPSVYEVIRLTDGEPQFLTEHYERLTRSLASMNLEVPFSCGRLKSCIAELVEESGITDHNIKIEVDVGGHSVMYLNPTHYPSDEMYANGVAVDLFYGERKNPNIKAMDQELRDRTDEAIRAGGLYEVLLTDRNGCITEGSRSNVFFIRGNDVYTSPSEKVLLGVTRSKVIEIIQEEGFGLHYESVKKDDLASLDAAFISGTSPEVLPISQIGSLQYDVNNRVLRSIMEDFGKLKQKH